MENEKILIHNKEYTGPTLGVMINDYGRNYSKECSACGHVTGPEHRIEGSVWNSLIEVNGKKYDFDLSKLREFCSHLRKSFNLENGEFSDMIRNYPACLEKKVIDYLGFTYEIEQPSRWYSLAKNKFIKEKTGVKVKKILLRELTDSGNNHVQDEIYLDLYPANIT